MVRHDLRIAPSSNPNMLSPSSENLVFDTTVNEASEEDVFDLRTDTNLTTDDKSLTSKTDRDSLDLFSAQDYDSESD